MSVEPGRTVPSAAVTATRTPRRRWYRLTSPLAVVAAALVAVLAFAAPAKASVTLNPAGPYSGSTSVVVSGTPPTVTPAATHVAIAVCNVSPGVAPGTRCDIGSATPTLRSVSDYATGISITASPGPWADFDFTAGAPVPVGTQTTCSGVGSAQCAVLVSYYNVSGGAVTQIGAELHTISFS